MIDEKVAELLHEAGPDPARHAPDAEVIAAMWTRGRRQRRAYSALRVAGALAVLVVVIGTVAFTASRIGRTESTSLEAGPASETGPTSPPNGVALGRIHLDAIGLDADYYEGDAPTTLEQGPVRLSGTASVGDLGTVVLFGHRTTFTAPFNRLDELRPGDRIRIDGSNGSFTYTVSAQPPPDPGRPPTGSRVVPPGEGPFGVPIPLVQPDDGVGRLLLVTYDPKYSADGRLVVDAALTPD